MAQLAGQRYLSEHLHFFDNDHMDRSVSPNGLRVAAFEMHNVQICTEYDLTEVISTSLFMLPTAQSATGHPHQVALMNTKALLYRLTDHERHGGMCGYTFKRNGEDTHQDCSAMNGTGCVVRVEAYRTKHTNNIIWRFVFYTVEAMLAFLTNFTLDAKEGSRIRQGKYHLYLKFPCSRLHFSCNMPTAMMHNMHVSVNREPAPMGGVAVEARLSHVEFPAKHQGNISFINNLRTAKAREPVGTSNPPADGKASPPADAPTAPMGMTTTPSALVPESTDRHAAGNSTAEAATASTWNESDVAVQDSDLFDATAELEWMRGEEEMPVPVATKKPPSHNPVMQKPPSRSPVMQNHCVLKAMILQRDYSVSWLKLSNSERSRVCEEIMLTLKRMKYDVNEPLDHAGQLAASKELGIGLVFITRPIRHEVGACRLYVYAPSTSCTKFAALLYSDRMDFNGIKHCEPYCTSPYKLMGLKPLNEVLAEFPGAQQLEVDPNPHGSPSRGLAPCGMFSEGP